MKNFGVAKIIFWSEPSKYLVDRSNDGRNVLHILVMILFVRNFALYRCTPVILDNFNCHYGKYSLFV